MQELLVSVRKLGQTLRKLAKAPTGTGEAAGMSDDTKIYLQVFQRDTFLTFYWSETTVSS